MLQSAEAGRAARTPPRSFRSKCSSTMCECIRGNESRMSLDRGASMNPSNEPDRQLLRHTLATVAYRAGKALRGAPGSFAAFKAGDSSRTPPRILAQMGYLSDWALAAAPADKSGQNPDP